MASCRAVQLIPVPGLPVICPGDDLAELVWGAAVEHGIGIESDDVIVFAQKIVSKSENRFVDLSTVVPSDYALRLARQVNKDPRLVETILSESANVLRSARDVLIVEHALGFVMANAGVDQSNVTDTGKPTALLLPRQPDESAAHLREAIGARAGVPVAVVINDSFGRAWRQGTVGVAIGVAGLPALLDKRGSRDLFGRRLEVTVIGLADEIAAAASLLMGAADEALPVVIVRGLRWSAESSTARSICRPVSEDLFR